MMFGCDVAPKAEEAAVSRIFCVGTTQLHLDHWRPLIFRTSKVAHRELLLSCVLLPRGEPQRVRHHVHHHDLPLV